EIATVVQQEICKRGTAYAGDIFEHRREHGLKVARGRADNLKHFGRRSLSRQGSAQFVEQSRILDGDNSLGSERLDKSDLLVSKCNGVSTRSAKRTYCFVIADQRN